MTAARLPLTTGWTEETRNQFHPGDIIAAIKFDVTASDHFNLLLARKCSPSGVMGMLELICHFLGEGREHCQPFMYAGTDGCEMYEYAIEIVPRVRAVQEGLEKAFPKLDKFAKALRLDTGSKIEEIENRFGLVVDVPPMDLTKEERYRKLRDAKNPSYKEVIDSVVSRSGLYYKTKVELQDELDRRAENRCHCAVL